MTGAGSRQVEVIHVRTGETYRLNVVGYLGHHNHQSVSDRAARLVGWRFIAECDVRMVPAGQETPLPFDELPLRVRAPRP